jgi:hypothetical protein
MSAKQNVSVVTLDVVHELRYTPAERYRKKSPGKDFSGILQPISMFVDVFQMTLKLVNLTSEAGENENQRTFVKLYSTPRAEYPNFDIFYLLATFRYICIAPGSPLMHRILVHFLFYT